VFQRRYYSQVGKKYVELDEIKAQIAEIKARQKPEDQDLNQEAANARTQAQKSAEEYESIERSLPKEDYETKESDEAMRLYRKIASIIHPDKATNDNSHKIRNRLMAELNEAYAHKNVSKMQDILTKWEESPDSIEGEGIAVELVKTIRMIAQIKKRIAEVEAEISKLKTSEVYELMIKVQDGDLAGRDILAEMAASLDIDIDEARKELDSLKG
jgi:predicted S18 family serine protease